ncbi:YggN family protein [Thalassotalea sediminis]|uniref:YggN family protein n=1 Tax=Thalassotalea sediminis TaxID=1759089 RepID=UPI00257367E5|nr:YggN family protein [Thalassotalea sediminis]
MKSIILKYCKLLVLIGISSFSAVNANASKCDINFQHGIIIDPSHIRILDHGQTIVQINNDKQLFVQGRQIQLTDQQRKLLNDYAKGIRYQIPEIVSIAIEGVDVGLKAVNKVIAGVTGENSASHQKLQKRFDEMQWRLRKRFNHSDESYYIAPQDFDDFSEIFAGEFEQEIETLVTESIGTILLAVGEAMTNNAEGTGESRVQTFDERMNNMGDELELEMSAKVTAIESKASMFCEKLKSLDEIETKLTENISSLSSYNLIQSL